MIEIIPAIDVIEGRCVRLKCGQYDEKTVYDEFPLEVARRFEDAGLKRLHLVDLDGAKAGKIVNYKVLETLASKTTLKIDFGGGIQTDKDVQIVFECGAQMVSVGSVAVKEKALFLTWLQRYGTEKVILSADVLDERIKVRGWLEDGKVYLWDLLDEYVEKKISYVACTEISRDGMLSGPGKDLYKKILDRYEGLKLIASGGVSSLKDVEELRSIGLHGVIIGRALYEGKILVADLATMARG